METDVTVAFYGFVPLLPKHSATNEDREHPDLVARRQNLALQNTTNQLVNGGAKTLIL